MDVNVLFIWDVRNELIEYISEGIPQDTGINLIFPSPAEESEYLKHADAADIIVGWRPSEELLEKAKNLSLYINPGAGVQHLLEKFRGLDQSRDITLVNGHGNAYFTAQHAVALLLSLTNKVIPHHNWMADGKWRRGDDYAKSIPLRGRRIGLLGYGAVNSRVHQFLSGFKNEFAVVKRSQLENDDLPTEIKFFKPSELHDFLDYIDVLIIAVPLTEETDGIIGQKELGHLGESGLLVNMSRGQVVEQAALYNALKKNTIAGAAIDVWYNYQPDSDENGKKYPYQYPFHELENIILSPHRGASPMDDLQRWNEVIENIKRFASGASDFLNVVDIERGY